MIEAAGEQWGTADEIAESIGNGLTPAAVRRWADRDGLASARGVGPDGRLRVRYLLAQARAIDVQKRDAKLGRRRKRRI